MFSKGQKVKGTYFGVEYTGVLMLVRPHTRNESIKHYIKLDAPIIIFGNAADPREEIIVNTFANTPNTIEAA